MVRGALMAPRGHPNSRGVASVYRPVFCGGGSYGGCSERGMMARNGRGCMKLGNQEKGLGPGI